MKKATKGLKAVLLGLSPLGERLYAFDFVYLRTRTALSSCFILD